MWHFYNISLFCAQSPLNSAGFYLVAMLLSVMILSRLTWVARGMAIGAQNDPVHNLLKTLAIGLRLFAG